jgi:hypothetical protein
VAVRLPTRAHFSGILLLFVARCRELQPDGATSDVSGYNPGSKEAIMQFSLRAFLIFVGLSCIYLAVTFALPVVLSLLGLTLLTFFFPPLIVGGVIYGRGAMRAFWIGCAASGFIPLIVALYLGISVTIAALSDISELDDGGRWFCAGLAACHVLVAVYGSIVVAMRWLCGGARMAERQDDESRSRIIHRRVIVDEPVPDAGGETIPEQQQLV